MIRIYFARIRSFFRYGGEKEKGREGVRGRKMLLTETFPNCPITNTAF
jgi:hypothetical protein